jgi:hypothetical protein
MPIKDPDGGLNFQNFNPRIITGKVAKDQSVTKRFYQGGSQIPEYINLGLSSNDTSKSSKKISTRIFKKLPR